MITSRNCLAALACTALLACQGGDQLTGPDLLPHAASTASTLAGNVGPALTTSRTQSISGNVTLAVAPDPSQPAVIFNYSFSANQKLDALALTPSFIQGQFHFEFRFSNVNVAVDGSVACFFVIANKARVAGVIDRTNDPLLFPVGSTMIWSVTDNDNSVLPVNLPAAAPAKVADTASPLLRLPGVDPLTFCLAGGFLPEMPVLRGHVQVQEN
jgi:hypothetical protein